MKITIEFKENDYGPSILTTHDPADSTDLMVISAYITKKLAKKGFNAKEIAKKLLKNPKIAYIVKQWELSLQNENR